MKKILGMLAVCLGFWFAGLTVVHADIKPLPPDYDPIQGGMVLRPPHDLWIRTDIKPSIIPIAYLPGGNLDTKQLAQLSYQVLLDGKALKISAVLDQQSVSYSTDEKLSLGYYRAGGLGIIVYGIQVGDYPLKILMKIGQGSDEYETDVTLHVRTSTSAITWGNVSSELIMSPLPQLVLWHHLNGEVTVETESNNGISSNELKWPTTSLISLIPPTVAENDNMGVLVRFKLSTASRQLTVYNVDGTKISVSKQFGIPSITAIQGQPIKLDLDYIHPRLGTKLEFIWNFYGSSRLVSAQTTTTPELPAQAVDPNATSIQLILKYFDDQMTVEYASSFINFTYKSQPSLSLPTAETTIDLPAIIQGPTTAKAGFSDWSVNQVGSWHFTITASTLKQTDGTTLPARLKWPDGTIITPNQPYTVKYSGSQVVPLSQIDWVFQQQPKAKAGVYQANLLFEAIAGP